MSASRNGSSGRKQSIVRPLLHLLSVAVVGIGSTVLLLVLTIGHSNADVGQLPFYVPGLAAACIGSWLALTERPRHHANPGRNGAGD